MNKSAMRKTFFLLISMFLVLVKVDSQNLPKTTQINHISSIQNFAGNHFEMTESTIAMGGYDHTQNTARCFIDGVDIVDDVFFHPNDTRERSSLYSIDFFGDRVLITGTVNSREGNDLQFRISLFEKHTKNIVKQYTIRNLNATAILMDQLLVENEYIYMTLFSMKSTSTIEEGYSGLPFRSSNGQVLGNNGGQLIQIRLSDSRIRTYNFPEDARFGGYSITNDESGNVFIHVSNALADPHFRIMSFDNELNLRYQSPDIQKNRLEYSNGLPLEYAKIGGKEYVAFFDGSFPGIWNITDNKVIVSSSLRNGLDWSTIINGSQGVRLIKRIPDTNKFVIIKYDRTLEKGNAWVMIMNTEAERSIYYRDKIDLTGNLNSFSRPNIVAGYFDTQKRFHYLATIHPGSGNNASLNGMNIVQNANSATTTVYSGILEGLHLNFQEKFGVENFSPQGGTVNYDASDGNNNIVYSGLSSVSAVTVNRQLKANYTAVREDFQPGESLTFPSIDLSNDRVYRTAVIDISASQLISSSNIITIFREQAPTTLGTDETELNNSFSVYPNPAKKYINFTNVAFTNATLTIYNSLGQKILFKNKVTNNQQLDVSSLQTGIYHLLLQYQGKNVHQKLVVKR